jgi:Sugar-binding cellulase-like
MAISRREAIAYGATGALAALATKAESGSEAAAQESPQQSAVPLQVTSDRAPLTPAGTAGLRGYDMRDYLKPRRLTLAMWDVAYVLRHGPGGSFADHDRVLDEAVEREYNTLRIDPLPQFIDLKKPERILEWADPKQPFMPWNWNTGVRGPVGQWIIEFVEKLHRRNSLHYTLSAWWFTPGAPTTPTSPPLLRMPATMVEGAEMWAVMLTDWKKRFGFDRLVYVDIANETPYFFPHFSENFKKATGEDFGAPRAFSPAQIEFFVNEINPALKLLRREFPELRFTTSIHGDLRWLDVPLELDCLDVHFYSDADPRWNERTRFQEFIADDLFKTDRWFAEFSDRSVKTAAAVAPMLRARQRFKAGQFAEWAGRRGAPLTTSESWASWFYIDHPKLDWGWLLDWAKWSVDDAVACGFWGWTPHNYVQPQFANWKDVAWHRALNERFLQS